MGAFEKIHCPSCSGEGRCQDFYKTEHEGSREIRIYRWVTCLRCEGTGIIRVWREPGIDKEWSYQPTKQEVEEQSQQEAIVRGKRIEAALQKKKIDFENHLAALERGAKTNIVERVAEEFWSTALAGLYGGVVFGFIIGLGGCVTGSSWAFFKASLFYCTIIGIVFSIFLLFGGNIGEQEKAKQKLEEFKEKHDIR